MVVVGPKRLAPRSLERTKKYLCHSLKGYFSRHDPCFTAESGRACLSLASWPLGAVKELQAIVRALCASTASEFVLATLVTVEGSSYRRPGARLLIPTRDRRIGSISGGCLEEDVLARAHRVHAAGKPETVIYDTTSENDLVWGVGLGCHGITRVLLEKIPPRPAWALALANAFAARSSVRIAVVHDGRSLPLGTHLASELPASAGPEIGVFLQTISPPTALILFGAGDDAQPLARLAKELGWRVTIADPRPAFATPERFPMADAWVVAPAPELVARTAPDADTLAVVMTHHYVHDVPLLRGLLPLPLAYLGLLGPKKRAEKILADLGTEGFTVTPEQRARLHAPVGLDLGADGPEQVALAIVAEMQAILAGRSARPLRQRSRPIHE
ncbi:MAG: XdhC/CoxI family protein [Opitutaceae bacterium]